MAQSVALVVTVDPATDALAFSSGIQTMKLQHLILLAFFTTPVFGNDNLIAHRLFEQQRYAEAAEIFTDPTWKGIALYRSSQWWRAAEAFIRANDYKSMHNLGNTYVKMGYYSLALEAYLMSLAIKPDFEDAQFNAELMRKLLSTDQDEQGQSALQRRGEEIDRVESEGDEQPGGSSEEGFDKPDKDKDGGEDREGGTDNRGPTPEASAAGDSGAAGSDKTREDDGSPEGGSNKGTESESKQENNHHQ